MVALSKKKLEQEPNEIEVLLPWHAAGTLDARDMHRVDEALASDPALARQYAIIREEYAETIALNESIGAPSVRAMQKLFAAIDAEPPREPRASLGLSSRIVGFFAGLSPRTLAWSAGLCAIALLLQAGVIGAMLMKSQSTTYQAVSLSMNGPITRSLVSTQEPPRVLVRFAPDARVADVTALVDRYHASIVGGAKGGLFRLQFTDRPMGKEEVTDLISRLQGEKIVSLAVATP